MACGWDQDSLQLAGRKGAVNRQPRPTARKVCDYAECRWLGNDANTCELGNDANTCEFRSVAFEIKMRQLAQVGVRLKLYVCIFENVHTGLSSTPLGSTLERRVPMWPQLRQKDHQELQAGLGYRGDLWEKSLWGFGIKKIETEFKAEVGFCLFFVFVTCLFWDGFSV